MGLGLVLLVGVVGCEDLTQEEELWVGAIDPSEEGGESFDDEVMLSAVEESSEAPSVTSKPGQEEEGESAIEDKDSALPVSDEGPREATPSESAETEPAVEKEEDGPVETETEETLDDTTGTQSPVEESSLPEEGATPTTGYVLFSVNMGCSGLAKGESVFVIGMDKWADQWAIAVELKEDEVPGHFTGMWEGDAGEYTFLLSFSGTEDAEWSPWYGVEALEGQTCAGDSYDNRVVGVTPGLATNLSLTHGYCDGCPGSCSGVCGDQSTGGDCFCDGLCQEYDDCCDDYESLCAVASCEGYCGGKSSEGNCYCDSLCTSYNDCCDDYEGTCQE